MGLLTQHRWIHSSLGYAADDDPPADNLYIISGRPRSDVSNLPDRRCTSHASLQIDHQHQDT